MRMMIPATSLALVVFCTMPAAAQGFEGTVTWAMGKDAKPMVQTYKGAQVRTDMTGGEGRQGAMIMDLNAKTMTMIMSERKMYMVTDMNAMRDRMAQMKDKDRKPPKITDTGKTETIAGKSCEIYRFAAEEGKPETMEMCVAKGMGTFMGGATGGIGMGRTGNGSMATDAAANPEYAKLFRDGFFPLRMSKVENGVATTTEMIVTKIDQGSVPASTFEVPAGYTEMKMPAGMGMPPQKP